MKKFGGEVLFLDRSDINTDEIIPAKYLTEVKKEALKPHLLEDLSLKDFNPKTDISEKGCIITRSNFGCGSSREHAPWALEVNGINIVIAESFARIFRQNMFNCGMIALQLSKEALDGIFALSHFDTCSLSVDIDSETLTLSYNNGESLTEEFSLTGFEKSLVKSGGWVEFADQRY